MKRIMIMAGVGLIGFGSLAACSDKVDRDKSVENIVDEAEELGLDIDRTCVEDLLDGYSDDELSDIKDALDSGEMSGVAEEFSTNLVECVKA